MKRKASLFGEGMGSSTLERKPLVRRGDYIYLVLPTAVSSAIRYFVIAELEEGGLLDTCRRALARIYADLIATRSEERRVGNECVSTCRSRWSQYPQNKIQQTAHRVTDSTKHSN